MISPARRFGGLRHAARGGKDSIDHPPGSNHHDDIINCVAGVLTGEIIQDWSGSAAWIELARRDMAAVRTIGGHPNEKPKSIERTWAVDSVEWTLQQQGLGGPPPPSPSQSDPGNGKGNVSAARESDEQIRELFDATLKG